MDLEKKKTQRWDILRRRTSISVKSLSETGWECITEAVKVVCYQLQKVKAVLLSVARGKDAKCYREVMGLVTEVRTFRFLIMSGHLVRYTCSNRPSQQGVAVKGHAVGCCVRPNPGVLCLLGDLSRFLDFIRPWILPSV